MSDTVQGHDANAVKNVCLVNFGCISSFVANTLVFMDHPHTVKKSICCTQLNSWNLGPKYYAQMFVPYEYTNQSRWVETDMTNFSRLFATFPEEGSKRSVTRLTRKQAFVDAHKTDPSRSS